MIKQLNEKKAFNKHYISEREEQIMQIIQESITPTKIVTEVKESMKLPTFTKSKNNHEKKFFLKVKPIRRTSLRIWRLRMAMKD